MQDTVFICFIVTDTVFVCFIVFLCLFVWWGGGWGVLLLSPGVLLPFLAVLLPFPGVLLPFRGALLPVNRRIAQKHLSELPFCKPRLLPKCFAAVTYCLHIPCKDLAWSTCQNLLELVNSLAVSTAHLLETVFETSSASPLTTKATVGLTACHLHFPLPTSFLKMP